MYVLLGECSSLRVCAFSLCDSAETRMGAAATDGIREGGGSRQGAWTHMGTLRTHREGGGT